MKRGKLASGVKLDYPSEIMVLLNNFGELSVCSIGGGSL
jgi:hypothetical protein